MPAALIGVTNVFGKCLKTRLVAASDAAEVDADRGLCISGGVASFTAWLKTLSRYCNFSDTECN